MSTTSTTAAPGAASMTAEEFAERHAGEFVELTAGGIKELPVPGAEHGFLCATITRLIGNHAHERQLGRVMSNDSFVKTRSNPDTVRGPDVCFYSFDRLPKGRLPKGLLDVPPDLVFEVRSPSDTWTDVFTKVGEYLDAGIPVVVLDPETCSASVYRPGGELQRILHNSDELTLPELPGFAVRVSELFE